MLTIFPQKDFLNRKYFLALDGKKQTFATLHCVCFIVLHYCHEIRLNRISHDGSQIKGMSTEMSLELQFISIIFKPKSYWIYTNKKGVFNLYFKVST